MTWKKVGPGWWWLPMKDDPHVVPGYHADVSVVIWPVWRFNVCRWLGFKPTHDVAKGWRIGLRRAQQAAESAIAAQRGGTLRQGAA